jgi:hypothetical protein
MCGPPVRDQKLTPSQLAGRPPTTILAEFLRMQQLLTPSLVYLLAISGLSSAGSLVYLRPVSAIEALYRFSVNLLQRETADVRERAAGPRRVALAVPISDRDLNDTFAVLYQTALLR